MLGLRNGPVIDVEVDPVDQHLILVGDSRGSVAVYDLRRVSEDGSAKSGENEAAGTAPVGEYPNKAGHGSSRAPQGIVDDPSSPSGIVSGHTNSVTCVAWYTHDTGMFVTGGFDSRLIAWDASRCTPAFAWQLDGKVFDAAMSPVACSHSLVAVATSDSRVRIADLATCGFTHTLVGHADSVVSIAWHPSDQHLVATGSRDGSVALWDIRRAGTGHLAQLAVCDPASTTQAALRQQGGQASWQGWAGSSPAPARPVSAAPAVCHPGGVNALSWGPSRCPGASGSIGSLPPGLPPSIPALGSVSPAEAIGRGLALYSTGADGAVRRWHVQTGPSIALNPAGSTIGTEATTTARVLHASVPFQGITNRFRHKLRLACVPTNGGASALFVPSPGGGRSVSRQRGAAGASTGGIDMLDADSGEELGCLRGHHADVNAVDWSAATQTLVSAGNDGLLLAWAPSLMRPCKDWEA